MDNRQKLASRLKRTTAPRKRIEILLALAACCFRSDRAMHLAYSQEAYLLAKEIDDHALMVDCLREIADAQFSLGDSQASLETYTRGLQLSDQLPETAKAALFRGMFYPLTARGETQQALELLQLSLDIEQRHNAQGGICATLMLLGSFYYRLSDYSRAFEYSVQSLEVARQIGNQKRECGALNRIALIYSEIGEREKAIATFLEYLQIAKALKDTYHESVALGNLGVLHHEINDLGESLKYLYAALELQQKHHDKINQISSYCTLANIYLDLGAYDEALDSIEGALALVNSIDCNQFISMATNAHYAKVLNKHARHVEAVEAAKQALTLMKDNERQEMQVIALEQIVTAYASLGEFEKAFEYQQQLLVLKLTVQKLQLDKDLSRVSLRYEVEKKEAEKEAYRLRSRQLETEVTRLGLEVVNRNDLLLALKTDVQNLIPSSNGSARILRSFVKKIDSILAASEAQRQFHAALDQLHTHFQDALALKYPDLTNTEKKVCSLIKLGLNSQQIGNLLFSSPRTVEVHRLKIRKKIHVPPNTDIVTFLNTLS